MLLQKGEDMATNILLVNQKGGVGKTTFADEIAWGLERRGHKVGFGNLDPQGGANHEKGLLDDEDAVNVIDTPGFLSDDTAEYAKNADIAIIPVQPGTLGLKPMKRTIKVITEANPDHNRQQLRGKPDGRPPVPRTARGRRPARAGHRSDRGGLQAGRGPGQTRIRNRQERQGRPGNREHLGRDRGGPVMAGKFKKSTSYFDVAAEKAEERQQKIVESASEPQKPAPQVRKAGRPKKGAEGASERLVQLSVYVPESYRKRLKQVALEEDKSVSDIARELFDEYLAEKGF